MNTLDSFFPSQIKSHSKTPYRPSSNQKEAVFSDFLTNKGKVTHDWNEKTTSCLDDFMENEASESENFDSTKPFYFSFLAKTTMEVIESNAEDMQVDEINELDGFSITSPNKEQELIVTEILVPDEELGEGEEIHHLTSELFLVTQFNPPIFENSTNALNFNLLKEETVNQGLVANIIRQFKAILAKLDLEEVDLSSGKEILKLLNQWSNLNSYGNTSFTGENENVSERILWDKLVGRYQTRTQVQTNTGYFIQARVTAIDIVNWLTSGIEELTEMNEIINRQNTGLLQLNSLPMSQIEQYVIHVNPNDEELTTKEQLLNRFQDAVKSSRFLHSRNGLEQLTFSIRPENLGEMTVKMARLNGEIIVKILVSSQTTRQVLEANMHQLKNTFAPHQVVIEETETTAKVSDTSNEETNKENLPDGQEKNSKENHSKNNNRLNNDEEIDFHELLINTKV